MRHKDTHLLTVGMFKYTPEDRFSAIHRSSSEDWVLEIRGTRLADEGIYECQVSTTPVRRQLIRLKVAEPEITMHGGKELHIKHGSRINISCEISKFPNALTYILWRKGEQTLVQNERRKISFLNSPPKEGATKVSSSLSISNAQASDTGQYRCSSDAGESKPISIHVITGETRAGLQVNSSPTTFRLEEHFSVQVFLLISHYLFTASSN